jgi:hypothetical protein
MNRSSFISSQSSFFGAVAAFGGSLALLSAGRRDFPLCR